MDISNPHDKFFRKIMKKIENSRSFLRTYLPKELIKHIDFNKLKILDDHFIDNELKEHYSDILYKVKYYGKPSYIYVLLEHKSYPDRFVAFQLLRYMVNIWQKDVDNKKVKKLTPIIPYVFYHGKKKWDIKLEFKDIVKQIPGESQYIPNFKYILTDISKYDDTEITGTPEIKVMNTLMKHLYDKNIYKVLENVFQLCKLVESRVDSNQQYKDFLDMIFIYIMNSIAVDVKKVIPIAEKVIKNGGDAMITGADKLRKEGRKEGIVKGIKKGKLEAAKKMLLKGMDVIDISDITGLPEEQIEKIKHENI